MVILTVNTEDNAPHPLHQTAGKYIINTKDNKINFFPAQGAGYP